MQTSQSPQADGTRIPLGLTDIPSHELFMATPPKELFHYTSLDGARGIVESKSIHLTKVAYLNDRSELGLAINLFRAAVERVLPTVSGEDRKTLLIRTADQLGSFERTNICVASFCQEPDLLSQWRSYASAGKGVSLGFSSEVLQKINSSGWARLFRCVYDIGSQQKIALELVGILLSSYDIVCAVSPSEAREKSLSDIIGYFNTTFLRVAPVLKDRHFSEEREWRLVTSPRKTTDPKFRSVISNHRVSQYYVYDFDAGPDGNYDFLPLVVLGPSVEPELLANALQVFCTQNKVLLNSVRSSQIPYRG